MLLTELREILPGSPDLVFRLAADPDEQLKWDGAMKEVERLGEVPLGDGARYRGSFTGFGKVEYEYADWDPPRRFSHVARSPLGTMRHTFELEPAPDGTALTQRGELDPTLLGRLLSFKARRMLATRFRQLAADLTSYLRTDSASHEDETD
ncbi:MAG: SRPBCC family protein [Actinobacteria bacterium]|nr:SRPBCC family protein [Actinomycetota bacterium]